MMKGASQFILTYFTLSSGKFFPIGTAICPESHTPHTAAIYSLEDSNLTGINDSMVEDADKIDVVLPQFLEFCKDCVLVAHNASFDVGFITKKAEISSKISEVNSRISEAESTLNNDKAKLEDLKAKKDEAATNLTTKKSELDKAKEAKTKLEQDFIVNNEQVSQELKAALTKFNEAEANVQTVKDTEAKNAQTKIDKAQSELNAINDKINQKKAEGIKKENSVQISNLNHPDVFGDNNRYDDLITQLSNKYGVDPLLVKCIILQESAFNPGDVSCVGATGLMQLMPETAAGLGVDPYTIEGNLEGGIKYIKQQLDAFGGDVSLALAAYNAGPGAVQQHGGVPPYGETQHYVNIITSNYDRVRG